MVIFHGCANNVAGDLTEAVETRVPDYMMDMNVIWKERRSGKQYYGKSDPRDPMKSCINESIPSHEVNKLIDVEMEFPLDEEGAVATPRVHPDKSHDGAYFTYRPTCEKQRAGVRNCRLDNI